MNNYYDDFDYYKLKTGLYDGEALSQNCKREQKEIIALWNKLDELSGNASAYNLRDFWRNLLLDEWLDNSNHKDKTRIEHTIYYIFKIKPIILKHIEDLSS
ncbi:hypothetical protein SMGD1_0852 [Sulfurimonas gotlandica GD1]|uniref:Uncharacterized protein n=1 Tax=Sulfurimonas gotlandica (strain DSM 19862 / JCM 16533 / GD1) TaxID=929558 RepID=H1FX69_SULGG|nr:hypothetical protein [Sulfurimonas gotlandica]EHP29379.1 hypothetical protein SMGD1_0852 [Sulfurimonas gotlandica GD1]